MDHIASWLDWLRTGRGLSANTLAEYGREVRRLALRGDLLELTSEALRLHLVEVGGKPATVTKRIAAIRSFYRYATRFGHRLDDPTAPLDRPKVPKHLPRPLFGRDAAIAKVEPRLRPVAVFMVETGVRLSEALAIDVTPPTPDEMTIRGKGNKDRRIPISADARQALDELGGRIPFSRSIIQRGFRKVRFSPHRLRHSFGCELAAGGADVGKIQDLMGHASPATTRGYVAFATDVLREAVANRRKL